VSPDTPIDDPTVKISRPFANALLAAGITTVGAAWAMSDTELLALHGVGKNGVRMLRELQSG
jgi:DNA-directed RNA polymerase alpha subunit